MDQFDRAEQFEQKERDLAIEHARKEIEVVKAIGECLWCGEPLGAGLRFCPDNNGECRDDWQDEQDRKARLKAVRSW